MVLHPDKRVEFDAYERRVMEILRGHGGELLHALIADDAAAAGFDELHVLTFPDQQAFESFRSDPRRDALSAQRNACIAETKTIFARMNANL